MTRLEAACDDYNDRLEKLRSLRASRRDGGGGPAARLAYRHGAGPSGPRGPRCRARRDDEPAHRALPNRSPTCCSSWPGSRTRRTRVAPATCSGDQGRPLTQRPPHTGRWVGSGRGPQPRPRSSDAARPARRRRWRRDRDHVHDAGTGEVERPHDPRVLDPPRHDEGESAWSRRGFSSANVRDRLIMTASLVDSTSTSPPRPSRDARTAARCRSPPASASKASPRGRRRDARVRLVAAADDRPRSPAPPRHGATVRPPGGGPEVALDGNRSGCSRRRQDCRTGPPRGR